MIWTPGEIRVEPDGTRRYNNGMRYRPVPDSERKYRRRRPEAPDAFRVGGRWFVPHVFLPDDQRTMPETRLRSSSPNR